jgi:uncharacterized membrane protein (DUF4010 family)
LWGVVLAFCALNFASYVARRAIGANRGYGIAGALGGLLSSTAVTITYSRRSRSDDDDAASLATGVIAACSVLILRILVISTVLDPAVALAALPYLAPALVVVGLMYRHGALPAPAEQLRDKNPLRFTAALEMAVAFQLALSVIAILRPRLGKFGLYGVSVALGLTDMDALTLSVSSKSSMIEPDVAARALAIGVVANTTFKLAIALAIGRSRFRRRTGAGLATMAVATALALLGV